MKNLNDVVQAYYGQNELSDMAVQRILSKGKKRYQLRLFTRVAAVLLLLIGGVFTMRGFQMHQKVDAIFAEIRTNHLKGESVTVASNDYSVVSKALSKLSFEVVASEKLSSLSLIGGLYCSVQENKAAQLKLLTSEGDTVTLFVTQAEGSLAGLKADADEQNGVALSIWQEGELFYGMALNR